MNNDEKAEQVVETFTPDNEGKAMQWFGAAMLSATVLALWFNVHLLSVGRGNPAVTAMLGLVVGVAGIVLGEIRR